MPACLSDRQIDRQTDRDRGIRAVLVSCSCAVVLTPAMTTDQSMHGVGAWGGWTGRRRMDVFYLLTLSVTRMMSFLLPSARPSSQVTSVKPASGLSLCCRVIECGVVPSGVGSLSLSLCAPLVSGLVLALSFLSFRLFRMSMPANAFSLYLTASLFLTVPRPDRRGGGPEGV